MPLGTEVGLGPGESMLDGDLGPPNKGTAPPPTFRPVSILWPNGWMDHDDAWYGDRPQSRPHCIRWELVPSCPSKGTQQPPLRPMSIVVKRSHISATAERLLCICLGLPFFSGLGLDYFVCIVCIPLLKLEMQLARCSLYMHCEITHKSAVKNPLTSQRGSGCSIYLHYGSENEHSASPLPRRGTNCPTMSGPFTVPTLSSRN